MFLMNAYELMNSRMDFRVISNRVRRVFDMGECLGACVRDRFQASLEQGFWGDPHSPEL